MSYDFSAINNNCSKLWNVLQKTNETNQNEKKNSPEKQHTNDDRRLAVDMHGLSSRSTDFYL